MSDTIAAIATGLQVSAIGVLRLSGDRAIEAVDALFRPQHGGRMRDAENRKLVYGTLCDENGKALDICLCTISRAPNSYTGEDTAELQCHGSPVVLRAALDALFSLGVRQALPGEFTKRAFLNRRMDLISAEAVADIIEAETKEAAQNAAGQLSGAISGRIDAIYDMLTNMCSHYYAVLDYPDEDIEDFRLQEYRSSVAEAADVLRRLSESYESGRFFREGIPAAIIGRPNAGKSSLLNALLGYDRAIVTDIAGTTRDTIEEKLRVGSVLLRLTDTAGLRETEDTIERLGVERSLRAMESAELILAVIDGSAECTDEDIALLRRAEKNAKAIVCLTKRDLAAPETLPDTPLPVVSVSSVTGEGLDRLREAIAAMFPLPEAPAGEILTNARQAEAVDRARSMLQVTIEAIDLGAMPDVVLTELEAAMQALGELNGRSVREDVTSRIFERFCVGK